MNIEQTRGIQQYKAVTQNTRTDSAVDKTPEQGSSPAEETAAKTDRIELSADASIGKMSDSDRAALVESLKADLQNQMDRFINMMTQTFQTQGIKAATAQDDSFWQLFASGNLTVDAETKAAAQQAISEDGYWGVKQTSERIFSMAAALAGDNVELMQKLQAAVDKGFEQAGAAWGGKLPSITDDTYEAVNKLFEDYYAQDSEETVEPDADTEKTEESPKTETEGKEEAE